MADEVDSEYEAFVADVRPTFGGMMVDRRFTEADMTIADLRSQLKNMEKQRDGWRMQCEAVIVRRDGYKEQLEAANRGLHICSEDKLRLLDELEAAQRERDVAHNAWTDTWQELQAECTKREEAEANFEAGRAENEAYGHALEDAFGALLNPDRPASDLSERERKAADVISHALELFPVQCPEKKRREEAERRIRVVYDCDATCGHCLRCQRGKAENRVELLTMNLQVAGSERDAVEQRLGKALAYVQHKEEPLCPKAWHAKDGRANEFPCTCGLDAVLDCQAEETEGKEGND